MKLAQLLTHFDRISEAPDAIPRLRRFILDLAVRGELVEQDPNDEPASELLQRLDSEKARLKKGAIRKHESTSLVEVKEQPFQLPGTWQWTRFGEISNFHAGRTPSRHDSSFWNTGDYPWISIADMNNGGDVLTTKETISERARSFVFGSSPVPAGTLIMSFKLTIGKISRLGIPAFHNEAIISIYPYLPAMDAYLFKVLPQLSRQGNTKDAIKGATLNRESLANILLPLPPLAEQHRIVARVDELMARCDRLETAQMERERWRDRLTAASLQRLSQPVEDVRTFREHSRSYIRQLPRLTARSEQIKQLRQAILGLAVRGKLVPQDPKEEHAFQLLKRIQKEKKQFVRQGSLQRDKVAVNGLPVKSIHKIPPNWTWTRIKDLFEVSRGGSPRPAGDPRYFGGSIPWITVGEITRDQTKYIDRTESGLTDEGAKKSRSINPGDLLLTNSGATLGVPKISRIRACINDGVAALRLFHSVDLNDFAYLYLRSETEAFRKVNQGMGQPNLNTGIIADWLFPLPPLAEQRRIIAKVKELMTLCDQLEAKLTAIQAENRRLLESMLHEALTVA